MPSHKRQRNEIGSAATPPVVRDPLADAINYAGLHADVLLQLGDGADVWSDAVVVSNSPWEDCGRLRYHVFDLSGNDVPRLLRRALEFDPKRWVRLDVLGKSKALAALAALQPTSMDLGELDDLRGKPPKIGKSMQRLFQTVRRVDLSTVMGFSRSSKFLDMAFSAASELVEVRQSATQDADGVRRLWQRQGKPDMVSEYASVRDANRAAYNILVAISRRKTSKEHAEKEISAILSRPFNCTATRLYVGAARYHLSLMDPTANLGDPAGVEFVQALQQVDFITRTPKDIALLDSWETLAAILKTKGCSATVAGVTFTAPECSVLAASMLNFKVAWLHAAMSFTGANTFAPAEVKLDRLVRFGAKDCHRHDRVGCLRRCLFAARDLGQEHDSFASRLTANQWINVAKTLRRGESLESLPESKTKRTVTALECCEFALVKGSPHAVMWRAIVEILAVHGDLDTTIARPDNFGWRDCAELALSGKTPLVSPVVSMCEEGNRWARVGYALPHGAVIAVDEVEFTKLQVCIRALELGTTAGTAWLGIGSVLAKGGGEGGILPAGTLREEALTACDCFRIAAEYDLKCCEPWAHLADILGPEESVVVREVRYDRSDCERRGMGAITVEWSLTA